MIIKNLKDLLYLKTYDDIIEMNKETKKNSTILNKINDNLLNIVINQSKNYFLMKLKK